MSETQISTTQTLEAAHGWSLRRWMDERFYPHQGKYWPEEIFRREVLRRMDDTTVSLDLGAGAGIIPQLDFRGWAKRICGIDLDPRVLENSFLDDAHVGDACEIPYPDESFDLVFSHSVFEHLEAPLEVVREIRRVLRPGGTLLIETPNRWHYMPVVAQLTPLRFHQFVNRLRGRAEVDTFPTCYRINSAGRIRRIAVEAGMEVEEIRLVDGRPEYLRISAPTYLAGIAYERLVNRFEALSRFRVVIIAALRRPAADEAVQERGDASRPPT